MIPPPTPINPPRPPARAASQSQGTAGPSVSEDGVVSEDLDARLRAAAEGVDAPVAPSVEIHE